MRGYRDEQLPDTVCSLWRPGLAWKGELRATEPGETMSKLPGGAALEEKQSWASHTHQLGPGPLGHRKRPFFTLCVPSRWVDLIKKMRAGDTHSSLELGAYYVQAVHPEQHTGHMPTHMCTHACTCMRTCACTHMHAHISHPANLLGEPAKGPLASRSIQPQPVSRGAGSGHRAVIILSPVKEAGPARLISNLPRKPLRGLNEAGALATHMDKSTVTVSPPHHQRFWPLW